MLESLSSLNRHFYIKLAWANYSFGRRAHQWPGKY